MRTKIVFFLIIGIASFLFSCEENSDVGCRLPYVRVNFSVDVLNTPELQTPLNPKYIGSSTGKKVGYKGHGIYVIRISNTEFRAFDASCTYRDTNIPHSEIKPHLELADKQKVVVICPECKSKYSLIDGSVQSGNSRCPLTEYRTRFSGNTLWISN